MTRICTWAKLLDRESGKTFHVFNTHLDHESAEARQKGMALILSRIAQRKPSGPVMLTGDLNTAAAIMRSSKDGVYPSDHFPMRATLDW